MAITCDEILRALPPEARTIQADDVGRALHSDGVRSALQGWQSLSGEDAEAANRLDRIVVYATVAQAAFDTAFLETRLREAGVHVQAEELRKSLNRLDIGFVIARTEQTTYRYRAPLMVEEIRAFEPDRAFEMEARRFAATARHKDLERALLPRGQGQDRHLARRQGGRDRRELQGAMPRRAEGREEEARLGARHESVTSGRNRSLWAGGTFLVLLLLLMAGVTLVAQPASDDEAPRATVLRRQPAPM